MFIYVEITTHLITWSADVIVYIKIYDILHVSQ